MRGHMALPASSAEHRMEGCDLIHVSFLNIHSTNAPDWQPRVPNPETVRAGPEHAAGAPDSGGPEKEQRSKVDAAASELRGSLRLK